jgi:hypothetical protein
MQDVAFATGVISELTTRQVRSRDNTQSVRSVAPCTDITMMALMFVPYRGLDPDIAYYGMTSSIHDGRDVRCYKDNAIPRYLHESHSASTIPSRRIAFVHVTLLTPAPPPRAPSQLSAWVTHNPLCATSRQHLSSTTLLCNNMASSRRPI